jgi:hypothetical protein
MDDLIDSLYTTGHYSNMLRADSVLMKIRFRKIQFILNNLKKIFRQDIKEMNLIIPYQNPENLSGKN